MQWTVSVNVTNTGAVPGAEVAQLVGSFNDPHGSPLDPTQYVSFPSTETEQPPRHLKGFSKPFLHPGQSKTVHFPIVSPQAEALLMARVMADGSGFS